jgi:hypothetical protein
MRRLHTENGTKLGCSFSGANGRTFHMTKEEAINLFNADTEDQVLDDGCCLGMTVEDLVEDFVKGNKATEEEMRRLWDRGLEDTLHFQEFQGLDENGDVQTGFKR